MPDGSSPIHRAREWSPSARVWILLQWNGPRHNDFVHCACSLYSPGLDICDTYSLPRLIGQQTATHSLIAPFPPGSIWFLLGTFFSIREASYSPFFYYSRVSKYVRCA